MITEVPGIRVGHWTGAATGVTVVLAPDGCVGAGEVRGGAPATRESALVEKGTLVDRVDAVVFSGGAAFGLASCDGVARFLAERGQGFPTPGGPVPIVVGGCIFDLTTAQQRPPGAAEGRVAAEAAERGEPLETGRVGAGAGATVGKWRGAAPVPGGVGSASAVAGDVVVGALAVVNAVGDVVGEDGTVIAGEAGQEPEFRAPSLGETGNTTLAVVATNARLDKSACGMLARAAHDGFARALHPVHTRFDGDFTVALATGDVEGDVDAICVSAAEVAAAAIRRSVGG